MSGEVSGEVEEIRKSRNGKRGNVDACILCEIGLTLTTLRLPECHLCSLGSVHRGEL